jgi:hypothetical protein
MATPTRNYVNSRAIELVADWLKTRDKRLISYRNEEAMSEFRSIISARSDWTSLLIRHGPPYFILAEEHDPVFLSIKTSLNFEVDSVDVLQRFHAWIVVALSEDVHDFRCIPAVSVPMKRIEIPLSVRDFATRDRIIASHPRAKIIDAMVSPSGSGTPFVRMRLEDNKFRKFTEEFL